jgi:dimethylaniline monooxygenase (N-oxide forming)
VKVAVIGAGASGLISIKELVDAGHDVTCFEMSELPCGVFAHTYPGTRLNSSSVATAFSSFSKDRKEPVMWTAEEYVDYLKGFMKEFNLDKYINYKHKILRVIDGNTTPDANSRWFLEIEEPDKKVSKRGFDKLVVCCGVHQKQNYPEYPGLDQFPGKFIHSVDFPGKDHPDIKGKKILVIGSGESASDVGFLCSQTAEKVWISMRSNSGHLIPRYGKGYGEIEKPEVNDLDACRVTHSQPRAFKKLMAWYRCSWGVVFGSTVLRKKPAGMVMRGVGMRNFEKGTTAFSTFGSKNAESLVSAIVLHGAHVTKGIDRLEGNTIHFVNGEKFEADVIIACTGFRASFPFLEDTWDDMKIKMDFLKTRPLFLHCIHPKIGSDMIVNGFARPAVGNIPSISELTARYYAYVLNGVCTLPSEQEMEKKIESLRDFHLNTFGEDGKKLSQLVDYLPMLDAIASEIGCLPPPLLKLLFTDFKLFRSIAYQSISSVQYRLRGPGATPKYARELLVSGPISYWWDGTWILIVFGLLYLITGLSLFKPETQVGENIAAIRKKVLAMLVVGGIGFLLYKKFM